MTTCWVVAEGSPFSGEGVCVGSTASYLPPEMELQTPDPSHVKLLACLPPVCVYVCLFLLFLHI